MKIKIFKSSFIRNVLILATGTIAAQLVVMGLSPIITRIYGPEKYGVLSLFLSLVAIVGPISALTYPIAIVLPKKDSEAKKIAHLSLSIALLIAVISGVLILIFSNNNSNFFGLKEINSYIFLIPYIILFSGLIQILENWLIRTAQFSISAKVSFFQALIIQSSIVLIGLFYPSVSVLILVSALGIFLKGFLMWVFNKKKLNFSLSTIIKPTPDIRLIASRYKDFSIYRAPEVLINSFSQSLPIFLLTYYFGPASAGFYSIGRTTLSIPTQLVGKAVGDVFYPRISEAANNKDPLTKLIIKATMSLALIGVVPFLTVIIFGPQLFNLVFGEEWLQAGKYARWMAIWLFFMFINQPSIKTLPALGAQSVHLKFTVIMLLVRVLALLVGYFAFKDDMIAIVLFSLTGAILNFLLIILVLKLSRKFDLSNR